LFEFEQRLVPQMCGRVEGSRGVILRSLMLIQLRVLLV